MPNNKNIKVAWGKELYNAYNFIKSNEKVYDKYGKLIGVSDGTYKIATYNYPGGVCLIKNNKYIWISINVENRKWMGIAIIFRKTI